MNRKQLTLVVILGLVLGGLGLWVARRDSAAFQTTGPGLGRKVLPDFPLNDIAQLVIRQGTNEVSLVRDQEVWKVKERHNYPANFTEIGGFLRKVWDLKVVQSETIGESQLPRLHLAEAGSSTNLPARVEFKDASGKTLATVLFGKPHLRKTAGPASPFGDEGGYPDGRWLLVPGAAGPKQAALVSETFSEIEPKADRWLNKETFFKVEKLKSIEVAHAEATNSWKVYRETEGGELKLAEPGPEELIDASKASPVGNALSWPSFVDVLGPDVKPEDSGLDQPTVAKLETFDGFRYTVRVGKQTTGEDNYRLQVQVAADLPKERTPGQDEKPEDKERLDKEFKEKLAKQADKLKQEKTLEPWTFLVSKWTIDPLLKTRKDLLTEKKDETKEEAKAPTDSSAEQSIGVLAPTPDEDGDSGEQ